MSQDLILKAKIMFKDCERSKDLSYDIYLKKQPVR